MKHAVVSLLALLLAVAGCISTPDVDPKGTVDDTKAFAADWWEHALPSSITVDGHEHNNRTHHAGITTPNFATLGWDPLETDTFGASLTGMGCGGAVTREDG